MMPTFAIIPSQGDMNNGLLERVDDFEPEAHIVLLDSNGEARLCTTPHDVASIENATALLAAPAFLNPNRALLLDYVKNGNIAGLFLHPGDTNSPNKADVTARMTDYLFDMAETDRAVIAQKTVAFSMGGDKEYRVPEFATLWGWFNDSDEPPCPVLSHDQLTQIYRRLWHRETLPPLLSLRIQLEGIESEDQPEAQRREWANTLNVILKSGEWVWLRHEESLGTTCGEFLTVASLSDANLDAVAASAKAFRAAIRTFAANRP